jgi:hypothetical protein
MLTSEHKQTILAAICVSFLVAVAFFSAYAGQYSSKAEQTEKINPEQRPEQVQAPGDMRAGDKPAATQGTSLTDNVRHHQGNRENSSDNNDGEHQATEFWPPFFGYRLKVTDTLIVCFTALLFAATVALWRSTGNLVQGAETTAQHQLRAYVHVHKAVRLSPHHAAPHFALEIKNYGHTPARNGTYWFVTKIAEYSESIGFDKPSDVEIGRFESAPGALMSFPGINVPPEQQSLTGEQMTAFQEGKIAFFVFGELYYTDVFDEDRITKFRVRYGNDGINTGRLATCETGNEST